MEIELPRGSDGKRRRRVIDGKTQKETKRKAADLKALGGDSIRPADPTLLADFMSPWLAATEQ